MSEGLRALLPFSFSYLSGKTLTVPLQGPDAEEGCALARRHVPYLDVSR
jgi:hypothetical protein